MQNTPPIPESAVTTYRSPMWLHDSHHVAAGHLVVSSGSAAAMTYAAFFDACTGVRPVALNDSPDKVCPRSFRNEYGEIRRLTSCT